MEMELQAHLSSKRERIFTTHCCTIWTSLGGSMLEHVLPMTQAAGYPSSFNSAMHAAAWASGMPATRPPAVCGSVKIWLPKGMSEVTAAADRAFDGCSVLVMPASKHSAAPFSSGTSENLSSTPTCTHAILLSKSEIGREREIFTMSNQPAMANEDESVVVSRPLWGWPK